MKNADMPAMPQTITEGSEGCGLIGSHMESEWQGLTKREMFAMHFMASLTKTYWENASEYESGKELVKCQSETAVEMADALLAELDKESE